MGAYIITTQRLGLREWTEADVLPFAHMNNDPDVMRFFPATLCYQETEALVARIKLGFKNDGFGLYAVETKLTKEFIGFTGFARPGFESFFTPCIEIGWRYKKSAGGQGFATEAAAACLRHGFNNLGFSSVCSFTAAVNAPSIRVMERIGMAKTGFFGHPNIHPQSHLHQHVLYQINSPL